MNGYEKKWEDAGCGAFPAPETEVLPAEWGITVRDYFAARLMPSMIVRADIDGYEEAAFEAYAAADFMLIARKGAVQK